MRKVLAILAMVVLAILVSVAPVLAAGNAADPGSHEQFSVLGNDYPGVAAGQEGSRTCGWVRGPDEHGARLKQHGRGGCLGASR